MQPGDLTGRATPQDSFRPGGEIWITVTVGNPTNQQAAVFRLHWLQIGGTTTFKLKKYEWHFFDTIYCSVPKIATVYCLQFAILYGSYCTRDFAALRAAALLPDWSKSEVSARHHGLYEALLLITNYKTLSFRRESAREKHGGWVIRIHYFVSLYYYLHIKNIYNQSRII